MENREYIKIPKSYPLPNFVSDLKELDDEVWKNQIFHHLLSFYKNYDALDLKEKIEEERKKQRPRVERTVARYVRLKLNENRLSLIHI